MLTRRRFLAVERLERREVLAGNVAVVIRGGNLFINGDGASNEISISRSGPSSITITGTDTTVNGSSDPVTLNRFTKNMTVNMGSGDDVVHFETTSDDLFRIFGNLTVNTGSGDDQVTFADTSIW